MRVLTLWYVALVIALLGCVYGLVSLRPDEKKTPLSKLRTAKQESLPAASVTTPPAVAGESTTGQPVASGRTEPAGNTKTSPKPSSGASTHGVSSYVPPAPPSNPSVPNMDVTLVLSPPPPNSGNSHGFLITIVPGPGSLNTGGKPEFVAAPNGLPCNSYEDGIYWIYDHLNPNDYLHWGWACNPYVKADGTMPYGEYPVTFLLRSTDGYGNEVIEYASGVIIYRPDQTEYENLY